MRTNVSLVMISVEWVKHEKYQHTFKCPFHFQKTERKPLLYYTLYINITEYDSFYFLRKLIVIHSSLETGLKYDQFIDRRRL